MKKLKHSVCWDLHSCPLGCCVKWCVCLNVILDGQKIKNDAHGPRHFAQHLVQLHSLFFYFNSKNGRNGLCSNIQFLSGSYAILHISLKVRLHRRCGPAILPSEAISIENFLSPRHRFEMDIPFEIYAPRNWNNIAERNCQPHIACVNTPLWRVS